MSHDRSCHRRQHILTSARVSRRSGLVLEKVCEYFYYHEKYANSKDVPDMNIPPELCLELLLAADYLNGSPCTPGLSGKLADTRRTQFEIGLIQAVWVALDECDDRHLTTGREAQDDGS